MFFFSYNSFTGFGLRHPFCKLKCFLVFFFSYLNRIARFFFFFSLSLFYGVSVFPSFILFSLLSFIL